MSGRMKKGAGARGEAMRVEGLHRVVLGGAGPTYEVTHRRADYDHETAAHPRTSQPQRRRR